MFPNLFLSSASGYEEDDIFLPLEVDHGLISSSDKWNVRGGYVSPAVSTGTQVSSPFFPFCAKQVSYDVEWLHGKEPPINPLNMYSEQEISFFICVHWNFGVHCHRIT